MYVGQAITVVPATGELTAQASFGFSSAAEALNANRKISVKTAISLFTF